ncbi:MAG: O-antigen ligase family protein [Beijerinckiaceae bacterium]|nr:O-antigen ligase family protein [Beijerinckiaceae bacterium]
MLLFPLSFAVGLTVSPTGRLDRLMGLVGAAAIIAAIIATQSRGGLLGMVAVFGTVGWRLVKNKMLLVTVGLIGLGILFAVAGISSRASGGAHEEGIDESAMGRIYAWEAAIKMATQRPLTGVGLDNFVPNYFFYSDHWDGMNHAVHSTWFGVLGETGLPGLIVFVTMITVTARSLLRALPRIEPGPATAPVRAAGLGLLSGVAGFCLSGTFLTQGFTWPVYVLVALSAALSRSANPVRDLQIRILAAPNKNP